MTRPDATRNPPFPPPGNPPSKWGYSRPGTAGRSSSCPCSTKRKVAASHDVTPYCGLGLDDDTDVSLSNWRLNVLIVIIWKLNCYNCDVFHYDFPLHKYLIHYLSLNHHHFNHRHFLFLMDVSLKFEVSSNNISNVLVLDRIKHHCTCSLKTYFTTSAEKIEISVLVFKNLPKLMTKFAKIVSTSKSFF